MAGQGVAERRAGSTPPPAHEDDADDNDDIDEDIRRLSAEAMGLLDSMADQVATPPRFSRTFSDDSTDGAAQPDVTSESDMHGHDIPAMKKPGSMVTKKLPDLDNDQGIIANTSSDRTSDYDENEFSDDESISKELTALLQVQEEIERELGEHNLETVDEKLKEIALQSPSPIKRLDGERIVDMTTEDQEIIKRALQKAESSPSKKKVQMKRIEASNLLPPKSKQETSVDFTYKYQWLGLGERGHEVHFWLLVYTIGVWAIVGGLLYRTATFEL